MGIFYPNSVSPTNRPGGQGLSFAGVVAGHIAVLAMLALAVPAERLAELAHPITVRLIEKAPEVPPPLPPPPPRPKPAPRTPVRTPPPVIAVANPVQAAVSFTVAPQPQVSAPVVADPVPAPAPPPLISARFDANYLQNPAPSYPLMSKRLGEEGKVLLRVFVSVEGEAKQVEIKRSSGFPRLDQAAEDAVARWRFVPAKRGDQAESAWVVVPITFSLKTES